MEIKVVAFHGDIKKGSDVFKVTNSKFKESKELKPWFEQFKQGNEKSFQKDYKLNSEDIPWVDIVVSDEDGENEDLTDAVSDFLYSTKV